MTGRCDNARRTVPGALPAALGFFLSAATLVPATIQEVPELEGLAEARRDLTEGRVQAAESLCREILDEVETVHGPDSLATAQVLEVLVEALWQTDDVASEETREYATRALAILETEHGPEHVALVPALCNLGEVLAGSGSPRDGIQYYARALKIQQVPGQGNGIERTRRGLANLYLHTGEYDRARVLYEETIRRLVVIHGPDSPFLIPEYYNLAMLLDRLGEFRTALELASKAVALAERRFGTDHPRVATLRNGEAGLRYRLGDHAGARRLYEQALEVQRRASNELEVAGLQNNLGLLLMDLGADGAARTALEEALQIRRSHLPAHHPALAQSRVNLALALPHEAGPTRPRELLESARRAWLQSDGPGSFRAANASLLLGELELAAGRHEVARADFEAALQVLGQLEDHYDQAQCHSGLAVVSMREGHFDEAVTQLEMAVEIGTRVLGPDHPLMVPARVRLAQGLRAQGNPKRALEVALDAERASRDHVLATARALGERQALQYALTRDSGLDLACQVATDPDADTDPELLLDGIVRSRHLVLDEWIGRAEVRSRILASQPEVWEEFQCASQALSSLLVPGMRQDSQAYRQAVASARQRFDAASRQLGETSTRYRAGRTQRQAGLDDIRRHLPADSALVSYFWYQTTSAEVPGQERSAYLALVLAGPDAPPALVRLGAARRIHELVGAWRRQLGTARGRGVELVDELDATGNAGLELRRAVWDPVARHLESPRDVFVVSDGALSLVNFAALPLEDGRFLIEREAVLHHLEAERDFLRAPLEEPGQGLLALGGPDYGPRPADGSRLHFPSLPHAGPEAQEIGKVWATTNQDQPLVLVGAAATERAIKDQAPGRQVVHIATHGFYRSPTGDDDPWQQLSVHRGRTARRKDEHSLAGLALAGCHQSGLPGTTEADDGILTATEVAALDLRSTEMVVLSACVSGVGSIEAAEGMQGFRRALHSAGSRTIVTSLWEVGDREARQWMLSLYRRRLAGASVARAARQASLDMIRDDRQQGQPPRPAAWGCWIVTGIPGH